jgi:hypothetical protein
MEVGAEASQIKIMGWLGLIVLWQLSLKPGSVDDFTQALRSTVKRHVETAMQAKPSGECLGDEFGSSGLCGKSLQNMAAQ